MPPHPNEEGNEIVPYQPPAPSLLDTPQGWALCLCPFALALIFFGAVRLWKVRLAARAARQTREQR